MFTFLTILHIVVALSLILFVLLQAGKGGGIGAAFGGGTSDTLFGAGGPAGILGKLTTGAAVIFMVTSLLLSYFGSRLETGSIVPTAPVKARTKSSAPIKPGPTTAPKSQKSEKPGS